MDSALGTHMLKSGIMDTMGDLLVNAGGALLVALAGYSYLHKGDFFSFKKVSKKFWKANKKLFR
jgi:hypothetical protein